MTVAGADATSLTWDGSDIVTSGAQGGSGTWNMNSTLNWWDGALGTDVVWPNAGSDNDAIFANTAGTVTLATGGVSANDLTFSSSGYLIQSETLTLNGTAPTITTDPGVSATISSVVAGAAGLVKSGSGTLTLTGANTYGGNTSVNAGTLVLRQQTNGGTITTASGATTEWQQTADMEWSFGLQPGCGIFAGAGRVNKTGTSNMYGDHASGGTFKVNQSAGAVFDMQGGRFNQGGGGGGFLSTNLGSLNVASGAAIGLFASNAVVDALTGSGTIVNDYPGDRTLSVGAANHTASVDNPYFTGTSATFSGTLGNGTAGTLALIKSGSGKQTLTGTNSYSGGTTVNGGSLQLGDGTTNGVITGNIANTANVTFNNASAQTFAGAISGTAGTLGKSGAGTLTLTGNNSYTGATTINVGTLEVKPAAGYTTTSSGYAVAAGAAFTFSLASANDATLASPLSGAGTVNLVNTGYSMHLNANNSAFTGTLKTSGTSALFLGTAAATSASTAYVIDMSNGGGYYGSLCTQNIADGSTIHLGSLSGTTPTSKISSGYNGSGTITWSIGALGTDTTFAGYFANYAMVTALTKVGSGKLTLTGANVYTGATTLTQGTLELVKASDFASNVALDAVNAATLQLGSPLAGDSWSFNRTITGGSTNAKIEKTGLGTVILTPVTGSSFTGGSSGALTVTGGKLYLNAAFTTAPAVSVAAGALFGGTATAGNVTLANTATLEGGMSGSGTLTAANLTIGSLVTDTATLKGTLSTTVGYKPLAVTNLALNGGDNTVTLDAAGAGLVTGTYYDLLVSTNVITAPNATSGLAVNVFKSNSRAYAPNVDATGTKVQLYYDATASVSWTGAASSAWNPTATNWKLSGNNAATEFMANDVVFFHDSPISSTVDISNGNVNPVSTTFDNTTATAYTLQGSNGIATGSLIKSGNGILTITNANSFGGGTTLSGGTLNLNNAATLGSGTLVIAGGTLNINNTATLGPGTVTLNGGTLNLNHAAALGTGTLVINGGVLDNTSAAAITLSTNNAQTWGGSMVFTGTKDLNLGSGAVAMTASHNVGVTAGTLTVGGVISGSAGSLTKSGNGTLVLGGANNYTGATLITAGTLEVTRSAFYTTTSSGYDVAAGAAFTFNMPTTGYDMYLSSPLSGTGTVNLVNNGWSMILDADNTAFAGTLTTSGNSALFLKRAAATSASTAYVIDMSNGGVAYGSLCTQNIADGSTIHLGSLSGTTPTSKISSGHGAGVGTLTWSIGALGTDTTFAGYFANYGMVTALTKVGSGTLTLTGANTYTGATNVSGGSLVLRQQHTGGTITTASGAITEWQQTAAMGYWHGLTGTITFAGAGRLNKTGAFDMYGDQGEGGNSIRVDQSAGGLFDMQAGRFDQGSGGGFKSTNRGSLNVAAGATIGLFTSNAMVDALTGSGTIVNGYGNSTVTLTLGAANHTSSVDNPYFTGTSATFSGALGNGSAGTLALTKTGSGTQILTGASTYSGGTIVSNGTLLVNNTSDSGTGSGAVTVTGGILGGTGSIGGAVTLNGGTLAPGASIGSLAVGGDLTFATATTFAYEMNHSAAAEATGDLLLVSGNSLSLAKATGEKVYLTLSDLAASSGAFAPNSTTLSLIQYAGNWNGGFFTYGTNELSDGEQFTDAYSNHWTIRYAAEVGGANFASAIAGSHFITLSNLTAIPEPGSLLALGCLVGSGMFLRSRRRN